MSVIRERLYAHPVHFWKCLTEFALEWEMFKAKVVGKIQTHILCSITSFFCGIQKMWANMVRASIIWHMCSACWINKAGDILLEYTGWSNGLCAPDDCTVIVRCTETFWSLCIIPIAALRQPCLHWSTSILWYMYVACLLYYLPIYSYCTYEQLGRVRWMVCVACMGERSEASWKTKV
jgi:hypothetical protein